MSDLKEEYQKFFKEKLDKYGVSSPDELSADDKKDFFNEIELEWEEGKGPSGKEVASSLVPLMDQIAAAVSEMDVSDDVKLAVEEAADAVASIDD